MKHVADRIRRIITRNANSITQRRRHSFDFVKTRKGVLRELMLSKSSGNLIGLISPVLGEGIFIVLVVDIDSHNAEEMISYRKYDVGDDRTSSTARISIRDIKGVCLFGYSQQISV